MTKPAPHAEEPLTPPKPPEMPMKPKVTPLKPQEMLLKPQRTALKCPMTPKKMTPESSGSAKDIMDHIAAKYGTGMSQQYSNVLALLASGKGTEMTVPKGTGSNSKGDHSYIKSTKTKSDTNDPKKGEPLQRGLSMIQAVGQMLQMPGPVAPRSINQRRAQRRRNHQNPRRLFQSQKAVTAQRRCVENYASNLLKRK